MRYENLLNAYQGWGFLYCGLLCMLRGRGHCGPYLQAFAVDVLMLLQRVGQENVLGGQGEEGADLALLGLAQPVGLRVLMKGAGTGT